MRFWNGWLASEAYPFFPDFIIVQTEAAPPTGPVWPQKHLFTMPSSPSRAAAGPLTHSDWPGNGSEVRSPESTGSVPGGGKDLTLGCQPSRTFISAPRNLDIFKN